MLNGKFRVHHSLGLLPISQSETPEMRHLVLQNKQVIWYNNQIIKKKKQAERDKKKYTQVTELIFQGDLIIITVF